MPERLSRGRREITELLHIAPIRHGPVQRADRPALSIGYADRLKIVLDAFNLREDQGFPSVIRIFRGIHTSQWALLDGDSRLLLSVVFDGAFPDYMRALARDVPGMLGLIWSNCEGWQSVANDPQQLIQFIERYQVRVRFLYAHHPQLTVPDIDRLIGARVPTPASSLQRLEAALSEHEAKTASAEHEDPIFESYLRFQTLIGGLYSADELDLAIKEAYGTREPELRRRAAALSSQAAAVASESRSQPARLAGDHNFVPVVVSPPAIAQATAALLVDADAGSSDISGAKREAR